MGPCHGRGRAGAGTPVPAPRPARPYQIQAAINAVHSDAPSTEDTDWGQIVALYDQLMAMTPTLVVALNRAVAVAELRGPAAALAIVDALNLDRYHLYHSVRGNLLRRLGRQAEAAAAYETALRKATTDADRAVLRRLLDG